MHRLIIYRSQNCQSFLWGSPIHCGPISHCTCVKMLDTSSRALHKCKLCVTVRFQRVTPWAVIAHKCLCKWWILTKRPTASQEMSSSSWREVTQRTKPFQILQLSLLCIFIAPHLHLKSLKTYLRTLNIFDLLLSIMQTDNYVYFLLSIDIYTVFLMSITESIKDKSVLTRKLCNCSLVCNLSLWYLYLLLYLHWNLWLVIWQTKKNTEKISELRRKGMSSFIVFIIYFFVFVPISFFPPHLS